MELLFDNVIKQASDIQKSLSRKLWEIFQKKWTFVIGMFLGFTYINILNFNYTILL